MNNTEFKNIKAYFSIGNRAFVVPNYQRGYKWSVKNGNEQSAVEVLLDNLLNAPKDQTYFLQGITVTEDDNKVILIDGQQRTTTLYLILWYLGVDFFSDIQLDYDIREKSKMYIHGLKNYEFKYEEFDCENLNQDIYYFKQAIKQIRNKIEQLEDKESFLQFLLDRVCVLYIIIKKEKATKTFTMMNGAKATMLQEELIKAEILRHISMPKLKHATISTSIDENLDELKNIISMDWKTNAKRSRYAREWDKWLYWWNRGEVQSFFNTEKPLGFLLPFYFYNGKTTDLEITFAQFKKLLIHKTAIQIFKELRDLQKSFEDIFSAPKTFNNLKLSLLCNSGIVDVLDIIKFFFSNKTNYKLLNNYAKWRLVGATHRQITKEDELREDEESKEQKADSALIHLADKFVYGNYNDLALKQLLRLNVEEYNKLSNDKGQKFDFTIYGNKSLEHIHPKSKTYHYKKDDLSKDGVFCDGNDKKLERMPVGNEWLSRSSLTEATEHSIGNLVLLDKNENSKFNDRSFQDKKDIYFNINEGFKSRTLLHSIAVFAKSNWTNEDIDKNQLDFLKRFKKDYEISEY